MTKYLAELLGAFTLTFAGAGAIIHSASGSGAGLIEIALAHGLALSVAVYATGHISGAHINPAVTCAMFATRKISGRDALGYIAGQLAGAALAALLLNLLFADLQAAGEVAQSAAEKTSLGATLGELRDPFVVIVIEAILTFFLVTTIFAVAVDERGPKNVYGFAIGLAVAADILCAGPVTGASMNPARSFGPALVSGNWTIHHAYWIGPLLGGCAAGLLYDLVFIGSKGKGGSSG